MKNQETYLVKVLFGNNDQNKNVILLTLNDAPTTFKLTFHEDFFRNHCKRNDITCANDISSILYGKMYRMARLTNQELVTGKDMVNDVAEKMWNVVKPYIYSRDTDKIEEIYDCLMAIDEREDLERYITMTFEEADKDVNLIANLHTAINSAIAYFSANATAMATCANDNPYMSKFFNKHHNYYNEDYHKMLHALDIFNKELTKRIDANLFSADDKKFIIEY